MAATRRPRGKKYYSVAEANATLPLVRVIAQDIAVLAEELRERHERLVHIQTPDRGKQTAAHEEELRQAEEEFERGQERMQEYAQELQQLGVEIKDYFTGLVDFPCWMDGREVYLCWRLGEPEVAHWHELEDGFAGRQKLMAGATRA